MTDDTDDVHRRLERQALRNVRGLVDKLEVDDRRRGPTATAVLIATAAVVGAVALIFTIAFRGGFPQPQEREIQPPDTWRPVAREPASSPRTPSVEKK